jgi:hypothetical protein
LRDGVQAESMNIFKVLPDLSKSKHLGLFHRAARGQWGADEIDWDAAPRISKKHLRVQLARTLTPLLMGEQSAFYSLSTIIPILGNELEVESQMFLTSMAMDEARHTELVSRVYHRLDEQPISLRRFPTGYLFQTAIIADEPGRWIVGSLVSEVLAKSVLEAFREVDLDPVLSELCNRILIDEARHLAFNHVFLSDRLRGQLAKHPNTSEAYIDTLRERVDHVLDHVPPMFEALAQELKDCGVSTDDVLGEVFEQSRRRFEKSVTTARKPETQQPQAIG